MKTMCVCQQMYTISSKLQLDTIDANMHIVGQILLVIICGFVHYFRLVFVLINE